MHRHDSPLFLNIMQRIIQLNGPSNWLLTPYILLWHAWSYIYIIYTQRPTDCIGNHLLGLLKGLSQKINIFSSRANKTVSGSLLRKHLYRETILLITKRNHDYLTVAFNTWKCMKCYYFFIAAQSFRPFLPSAILLVHILFWIYVLNTQKTLCIYISILSVIFLTAYKKCISPCIYCLSFITFFCPCLNGRKD
jgi:hypothetical protein